MGVVPAAAMTSMLCGLSIQLSPKHSKTAPNQNSHHRRHNRHSAVELPAKVDNTGPFERSFFEAETESGNLPSTGSPKVPGL